MPTDSELTIQIDILRTCLREAMTTVRRLECGQKVGKRELLARWAEVVIASRELSREARPKATGA
jgi:hypothetical protein